MTLNIGEKPREDMPSRYSEIIEDYGEAKYLLSSKACQGILRRADKKGAEIPDELRTVLEKQSNEVY